MYVYTPHYLVNVRQFSPLEAKEILIISSLTVILIIPYSAFLATKFPLKKLIYLAIFCLTLILLPYYLAVSVATVSTIILFQIIVSMFAALIFTVAPMLMIILVRDGIRCSILSILYNLTASIFGGLAPLIAIWIQHKTNNIIYVGAYFGFLSIICFYLLMRLNIHEDDEAQQLSVNPSL